jgi:McrBC 5-methylcytosine restriction system component
VIRATPARVRAGRGGSETLLATATAINAAKRVQSRFRFRAPALDRSQGPHVEPPAESCCRPSSWATHVILASGRRRSPAGRPRPLAGAGRVAGSSGGVCLGARSHAGVPDRRRDTPDQSRSDPDRRPDLSSAGIDGALEVSYDEFTVDIVENRILRSALRRMLSVPRVFAEARAKLTHLDGRLEGVGVVRPRAALPSWQRTRLNERYQPALRLAEVVLRNTSAEAGPAGVQVAAFVVQMWQVFEDFVGTALAESLRRYPGTTQTFPQYRSHLDVPLPGKVRGEVPMALDVVHLVHQRPRLIFDAKYKVAGAAGRYPNADHYQMLAYCTALNVPVAWLVYAHGGGTPVVRIVRNTEVNIVEYPLDLRAEPPALLKQIDRLADHAWAEDLPGLSRRAVSGSGAARFLPVMPGTRVLYQVLARRRPRGAGDRQERGRKAAPGAREASAGEKETKVLTGHGTRHMLDVG